MQATFEQNKNMNCFCREKFSAQNVHINHDKSFRNDDWTDAIFTRFASFRHGIMSYKIFGRNEQLTIKWIKRCVCSFSVNGWLSGFTMRVRFLLLLKLQIQRSRIKLAKLTMNVSNDTISTKEKAFWFFWIPMIGLISEAVSVQISTTRFIEKKKEWKISMIN